MNVFDRVIVIHNRENDTVTRVMLEELDKMLYDHDIEHSFMLYMPECQDTDVVVNLLYQEEDEITVDLILMLWAKLERHYTDDKIKEMMRRVTK